MAILCDDCKNFKYTYDPQMSKYCSALPAIEYPFLLAFSRKRGRGRSTLQRLQVLPRKKK